MSGHSKWSKIQHKKGAADAKRGNIFTKLGKAITIAAQQGGGDPEMNFSLRMAIEKAKSSNMPKDNIEKAVKKGSGESKDGAVLQEIVYEAFGPHGVAMLIESVTDNTNRSVSEIKGIINKYNGSLGGPGSVQWQFEQRGVVRFGDSEKSKVESRKSDFELALIEAGADDIEENEFGIEIQCPVEKFKQIIDAVASFDIEPDDSGLEWIAKEAVNLDEDVSTRIEKLCESLDELDDVNYVYTNEA